MRKLPAISLNHIVYFITIAELGTMTKASEHLCVTQPLLSQKIQSLENEIGVQLFFREKRRIRLTAAGNFLYKEWANLLKNLQQSIEHAHDIQNEEKKRITIGFSSGTNAELIQKIAVSLRDRFEDLVINIKIINLFNLRRELLAEALDIIVFPDYEVNGTDPDIVSTSIAHFHLLVTMHSSNPLASNHSLKWEDLKTANFLITYPSYTGSYEKAIGKACAAAGFIPNIVYCGPDTEMQNVFMGVVMGDGVMVTLVPGLHNDSLSTFVMEGDKYPVTVAWKRNPKAIVQDFAWQAVDIIRDVYKKEFDS